MFCVKEAPLFLLQSIHYPSGPCEDWYPSIEGDKPLMGFHMNLVWPKSCQST